MDGPVFGCVGVDARTVLETLLADEDLAGIDNLPRKPLYAAALGDTVSAVCG